MSSLNRSEIMSRIRSKNTNPELLVRGILTLAGVDFQQHPPIYGSPDFRVGNHLIFVDGCFWHGCKQHCRMPKTNVDFWKEKITRNRRRDRHCTTYLKKLGYKVRRIWEHDLKLRCTFRWKEN